MTDDKRLRLDEASLEFILNFTLKNLKEDRRLALQHHDTLASLLSGPPGAESLSGLEIQMMVQELSGALTNFLRTAAVSTEQGLKMAKILSDLLTKIDTEDSLTDEDRADMMKMIEGFDEEKENIDALNNVIGINQLMEEN